MTELNEEKREQIGTAVIIDHLLLVIDYFYQRNPRLG